MSEIAAPARVALVGNPNSGKTALFNALTGSRQKVANYPGVTVERKTGDIITPAGKSVTVLDLPGTYSLRARSPDEQITCDIVLGRMASEPPREAVGPTRRLDRGIENAVGFALSRAQLRRIGLGPIRGSRQTALTDHRVDAGKEIVCATPADRDRRHDRNAELCG